MYNHTGTVWKKKKQQKNFLFLLIGLTYYDTEAVE